MASRKHDGKSRTFRFLPGEWDIITRVAEALGMTRTDAVVHLFEQRAGQLKGQTDGEDLDISDQ